MKLSFNYLWVSLLVPSQASSDVLYKSKEALMAAMKNGQATKTSNKNNRKTLEIEKGEYQNIIGGDASDSPYPYFAWWEVGCGASLVHEDIVLSAAQCFDQISNGVHFLMGGLNLFEGAVYRGIRYVPHPDYNSATFENDIMIIRLDKSALTNTNFETIPLNRDATNPMAGDPLSILGFGQPSTSAAAGAKILFEAEVDFVPDDVCALAYPDRLFPDTMLCAGVTGGGIDACNGDGGGPIIDPMGRQVGVISWGEGCGEGGFPGVYAQVDAFADWIDEQICRYSCNPPASCSPDLVTECTLPNDDFEWPGKFPTAASGAVTINFKTDDFPKESFWYLSKQNGVGEWLFVAGGSFANSAKSKLFSYTRNVDSSTEYRLTILDSEGDGNCCELGYGYITITNGVASSDSDDGSIVYSGLGTYEDEFEVYFSVDANGIATLGTAPDDGTVDVDFPGFFPPASATSTITLNIRPDFYPKEIFWSFSKQNAAMTGFTDISSGNLDGPPNKVYTVNFDSLEAGSLYRVRLFDDFADGFCCVYSDGWYSITTGTPSADYPQGTVLAWQYAEFTNFLDVHIYVDPSGVPHHAVYLEEFGWGTFKLFQPLDQALPTLVADMDLSQPIPVKPESVRRSSGGED